VRKGVRSGRGEVRRKKEFKPLEGAPDKRLALPDA